MKIFYVFSCFLLCFSVVGGEVLCDDKKSTCPDGMTCCQMESGAWGCCPLPMAVCCEDHIHCCPEGTTCNLEQETCDNSTGGSISWSWSTIITTRQILEPRKVVCDKATKEACPDGTTCCQAEGGQWGCCPLPNAVCCNDHRHCCPHNTTCDVAEGRCIRSSSGLSLKWFNNISARKVRDVECPDKSSSCPDGTTCCQLESGEWGCCPFPNAVCCADHIHCCPESTTCNTQQQTCEHTSATNGITWMVKYPARKYHDSSNDVHCPDPSTTCKNGETCCKFGNPPTWGCCHLPHAVCCPDFIHCCPSGTHCTNESQCVPNFLTLERVSATPIKGSKNPPPLFPLPQDVECPDHKTACVGDQVTCCELDKPGNWGCCEFANAVCCANRRYCCPANTTCSLLRDQCYRGNGEIVQGQSINKNSPTDTTLPMPLITEAKYFACGNGTKRCFEGTTCCQTESGYDCCPHKDGQCCADGKHCCPIGSTCDVGTSKCLARGGSFDWSSISVTTTTQRRQCADGVHFCTNNGKCCKSYLGTFSCCPDPKGVCCRNGKFCCPNGSICQIDGSCSIALDKNE